MESALPAPASQPPVFERRLHERSEFRNFDLGQRREPSLLFKVYGWAQIAALTPERRKVYGLYAQHLSNRQSA